MKSPIESPIVRVAAMFSILAVLAAMLTITTSTGCAGNRARSGVLLPAMVSTANPIERYAVRGALTASDPESSDRLAAIQAFFLAIRSEDVAEARMVAPDLWPVVEASARAGVQAMFEAGEIGPNGSMSLIESIEQFGRSVAKLSVGPAIQPPSP